MSPMFGGKKGSGKTVALVDIESGSVAAALARLSRGQAPQLFAESRVSIPVLHTRDATTLSFEVERALDKALSHTSDVAARIRNTEGVASHGEVDRAAVFFSPPWAAMHLSGGTADFVEPMRRKAHLAVRGRFGEIPTSFHPLGTAAAHGSAAIFRTEEPVVLCIINGEVSEILIVSPKALLGRASVPVGSTTLMRTLMAHSGMSAPEAHSFISLPREKEHALYEPLLAAEDHVAAQIAEAVSDLKNNTPLAGIILMTTEPMTDSLARALTRDQDLAELFPHGGVVRAMRPAHAMPYIAAHARNPDLALMLEALFINASLNS
jgi:hypothetical protein